jgi:hypothetical protein
LPIRDFIMIYRMRNSYIKHLQVVAKKLQRMRK